jgi:DMSO/TMAO reductase YedYZ molybdopterin-dependent catalytic subunit
MKRVLLPFIVLFAGVQPAAGQTRAACPVARPGNVVIYGDVQRQVAVPYAELRNMPHMAASGTDHEGKPMKFTGVPLRALLTKAGVTEELKSGELDRYVMIEAADGYRALFAKTEMDPAFRESVPILADEQDGKPLTAEFGPVQVIVPGEARHARWVRQVTCIRVGRDSAAWIPESPPTG